MKANNESKCKRSIHNKPTDEEYIIDGCKVRLYYADKDDEAVPDIMKMIEKCLIENYILAS